MEKGTELRCTSARSATTFSRNGWSHPPVVDSNPWWLRPLGFLLKYHAFSRSSLTKRMLKQSAYKLNLGIRQPATAHLSAYLINPRLLITSYSTLHLDTNKTSHLLSSALSWLSYFYWRQTREKLKKEIKPQTQCNITHTRPYSVA